MGAYRDEKREHTGLRGADYKPIVLESDTRNTNDGDGGPL